MWKTDEILRRIEAVRKTASDIGFQVSSEPITTSSEPGGDYDSIAIHVPLLSQGALFIKAFIRGLEDEVENPDHLLDVEFVELTDGADYLGGFNGDNPHDGAFYTLLRADLKNDFQIVNTHKNHF